MAEIYLELGFLLKKTLEKRWNLVQLVSQTRKFVGFVRKEDMMNA